MERQQATLESIREKYYHSDMQLRYWQMQKKGFQKLAKYIFRVLSLILAFQLLAIIYNGSLEFLIREKAFDYFLLFIGIWLLYSVMMAGIDKNYQIRNIKKINRCEQAILMWNLINREYKELFKRAEQGGIVDQDAMHRLEKYEIEISIQMKTLTTDIKNLEQAEIETQEFFKFLTNPS